MPSQKQVPFEYVTSLVYERKFDTALRLTTSVEFLRRLKDHQSTPDDLLLIRSNKIRNIDSAVIDGRLYSLILKQILDISSRSTLINPKFCKTLQRLPTIVKDVINIQWDYMNSQNYLLEKHHVQNCRYKWLDTIQLPCEILNLLTYSQILNGIIIKANKIRDKKFKRLATDIQLEEKLKYNHATIKSLDLDIIWSERLVVFVYKEIEYIMPFAYLLLIYNKINDLCSVLLYSLNAESNCLDRDAYRTVLTFVQELITLHIEFKTNYYTIAKTLESLCVAETLLETEEWKNREFLLSLMHELNEEIMFDYINSHLRTILLSVSTPMRHELCCLSKLLGHPFVDMKEGSYDLFSKVQESLTVDLLKINECVNYIKENYIRNHILRHGKWPPVEFDNVLAPKALVMACMLNQDPNAPEIKRKYGKVYIDQYSYINLRPNMKFSYLENYIPYLKDKTITLCRTKLIKHLWPKDGDQIRESWRETRLLLVYLLNSSFTLDHVNYIDKFIDSETLEDLLDYLVIRIVPKEKELKIKFRGFGCKSYEDRARALVQEKNVMEFLDTYSDEQAMTLGELPLARKLYAFRTMISSFKGHKILYINLDASSWNNRFRRVTTDHVMYQTLDDIFDKRIFSKTHLAYEKTFFYVPDEGQFYYWDGQSGGIEGLNQDTWVVVYLGQIKSAMKPLGYNYYVLCKGDDVRIAVLIPPIVAKNQPLASIKSRIVKHLQSELSNFGHKIKIAESYGSENYFTFSKIASLGVVEMPQVMRKIQKTHGANNAFIATLDEYIASAFSNAHSSCKVAPTVTPVYTVALYWSLFDLITHYEYKKCTDCEYMALMLVPSIVGGFPIIYLHNMFVRAESDLLSPFIGLTQFSYKYNHEVYTIMANFLKFSYQPPTSLIGLYKDPYSLPLNRPVLPTTLLRMQIIPSLHKLTRNEAIKELFEYIDLGITEEIVECLASCNVQNVKIFSNVYAATPRGLLEELLRKFETSRSVYELLILRGGDILAYKVMSRVYGAERRLQHWRFLRLRGIDHRNVEQYDTIRVKCPAEVAQSLRCKLWGKKIEGITMPPLQHQIMLMTPMMGQADDYILNNHFTYHVSTEYLPSLIKRPTQHYLSCGKKPFLGYATRSGTIAPTVHFIEKDSILTKVKNILDLISWTSKQGVDSSGNIIQSNFHDLLHFVIKLYSPEAVDKLGPFSGKQKSGTVQHHMRSPSFKEAIVPNVLSNIFQQFTGITNSHLMFRRSKEHFRVNYLHIYCYVGYNLFQSLDYGTTRYGSEEVWAVTTKCNYCLTPILETPLICDTKCLRSRNIRPLTVTNIGSITERLLVTSVKEFEATGIKIGEIPTELDYETACAGVIQEFIDQSYTSHIRLATRYGIMNMTEESRSLHVKLIPQGKSRDIGQTELKNITPEFLLQYIVPKIHLELILMFPKIHQRNASVFLSSIPGGEFPWYNLVHQIYKSGQLGRLIQELHKLSNINPSNCFDNPLRASYYLALTAFYIQEHNPVYGKFVLMSNYKDSDILSHLKMYSLAVLRRIIIKELIPSIKVSHKTRHIEHTRNTYLRCMAILILYCCRNMSDEENYLYILDRIKHIRHGKIVLLSSDAISPTITEYDTLQDLIKSEELVYLEAQLTYYPNWDWENAYTVLKEDLDELLIIYDNYAKIIEISVVYTDLPTCIACVRSRLPHDEILDNLEIETTVAPSNIEDSVMPYTSITSKRILHMEAIGFSMEGEYFSPLEYDFTTTKTILQECYLHRIYGEYTTSLNKICELLDYLNLPQYLGSHLDFACLGEGYGGILDLIAHMCTSSRFIYTTVPSNLEIETYPYIASQILKQNNHHVDYAHHSIGIYDLTDIKTFSYFEKLYYRPYITICDAEIKDFHHPKRLAMILNVITYYLRNRSEHGLLILKMNICEHQNIHYAVGLISPHCGYHGIFRCNASGLGGEVYLYAYGGRYTGYLQYSNTITLPNLSIYTRVEKYREQIYNMFKEILSQKSRVVHWNLLSTIHRGKWKDLNLGSSGFSKLVSRCEFPSLHVYMYQILAQSTIRDKCTLIYNILKNIPDYYIRLLNESIEFETRVGVWDITTRRHKTILAEKWLRQQGFLKTLHHIMMSEDKNPLEEQRLREFYHQCLSYLPPRLGWLPLTTKSFNKIIKDNGFESRPYEHFMEGCNIALMTISWLFIN